MLFDVNSSGILLGQPNFGNDCYISGRSSFASFLWFILLQLCQHIQLCQDTAYLVFQQHFPS
jgi:hypothetical protein